MAARRPAHQRGPNFARFATLSAAGHVRQAGAARAGPRKERTIFLFLLLPVLFARSTFAEPSGAEPRRTDPGCVDAGTSRNDLHRRGYGAASGAVAWSGVAVDPLLAVRESCSALAAVAVEVSINDAAVSKFADEVPPSPPRLVYPNRDSEASTVSKVTHAEESARDCSGSIQDQIHTSRHLQPPPQLADNRWATAPPIPPKVVKGWIITTCGVWGGWEHDELSRHWVPDE